MSDGFYQSEKLEDLGALCTVPTHDGCTTFPLVQVKAVYPAAVGQGCLLELRHGTTSEHRMSADHLRRWLNGLNPSNGLHHDMSGCMG